MTGNRDTFHIAVALALIAAAPYPQASAQSIYAPNKIVEIVQVTAPPEIDGVLDEEIWANAAMVSDLHQMDPIEYSEPSERSEFYLAYDRDALYVGARMWDTQPGRIAANILRQGANISNDDLLLLILDPYNNGREGYQFQLNPNGVRYEGLFLGASQMQWNWDGIWQAAATQDDEGWHAEMAIPFKTLSFETENDIWGINFGRRSQSKNERMAWVSRNRTQAPSISGRAIGLRGMDQGRGLDVVPSVSISDIKEFHPGSSTSRLDPSLDVFYRLTPGLNGSLTINTDFSATEVDDRQVNLTRFGLFFPEKRDFFLQDASAFEFGGIGSQTFTQLSRVLDQNARPFFSRRIGLSRSGQPVDLNYGAKLSGRVGPWTLGSLAIRQDAFGPVEATDLFVGRAALDVLEESSVGVITTFGDPRSNRDNSLMGVDFRYLNTRLPGRLILQAEAWYQQTETEGLAGDDAAYGVRLRMPGLTGLRAGLGFKEVQANFNPALGYLNRAGIRDYSAEIGWIHRKPQDAPIRTIHTLVGLQRVEHIAGGLQSEVLDARLIGLTLPAGDSMRLLYTNNREVLREPFAIWDPDASSGEQPITIPAGEYAYAAPALHIQSESSRKLSGEMTFRRGGFYGGERNNIEVETTWFPTRHFRAFVSYGYNDIELPEGDFTLKLARVGLDIIFSNTLSWASLIQYDNGSETIGINSRLHWVPEAGREGFIVLNHNLLDPDRNDSFNSSLAGLSLKFSHTFRF